MDLEKNESNDPGLSSAEYRTRLLTKLNCLIAVLEVAIQKISRSMDVPGANSERLTKIRANLENTMAICTRAKQTLERGMLQAPPHSTAKVRKASAADKMSYRDYVELSSIDEYQKFKTLPPIKADEIADTDFDDLLGKLLEG